MTPERRLRFPLFALLLAVLPTAAQAQVCGPAACGGDFHHVDFESLAPGALVLGPGTLDPDLTITSLAWALGPSCPVGSTRAIEEGNSATPFGAYSTAAGTHGCLNGTKGMADPANCVLDYDFSFPASAGVYCFGIRMFDFGDYYPYGGATHSVTLTAFDASNLVLDTDVLTVHGGVDSTSGDACLSQAGLPGNYRLVVSGPGIVRVELRFDAFPDPNVGFDDITFCMAGAPTAVLRSTWGRTKSRYR